MHYVELQVTSNFSFLRGASHPDELVEQAAEYGYKEIAITDRNTLAGIVRAHAAAKAKGIRIIPACRLDLQDGPSLLAYPTDQAAYSRLSSLLTTGNLRAEKGDCLLYKKDVYAYAAGMIFIVVPPEQLNTKFDFETAFKNDLKEYKDKLGSQLYLSVTRSYLGDDHKRLYRLAQLSALYHIPLAATNDVHYHHPERRQLQDILTCVREKCTIYNAGFRLHQNAERHLKTPAEMQRLFRQYPETISNARHIADACRFTLESLKYVYPEELTTEGRTPQEELTYLSWEGAKERFGDDIPEKISSAISYELTFIEEMNYAAYFLTVHDIVRFARSQHILCQGRGSAANSTVCYVLGITSVNPTKIDLLFERFISSARNEPPDIDVDFEHERREEVMQYVFNKYGRDRAAIVATVTQQHQKGAIRDVGKAMGLSVDTINRMSTSIWRYTDEWFDEGRLLEHGLNPEDPHLKKVLALTKQMMGFPRQLGQHTGGFVITQGKLHELCPILNARMENRTCIEWNKDDIDTLGFMKIDVLALGMLTCIRKAFDLAKQHYGKDYTLANIPEDDPAVYEMISHADTIGVFQIESRAQQSMLPRLRPQRFYDLVIEVAIVRPGPIQGDMVHPYLRRRNGQEAPDYPPQLEDILKKTLGVPLFQEQAMNIAIKAASFTPTEADELRRSMATFRLNGVIEKFEKKLIDGMTANGYELDFAQRIFKQLKGFGSYGFPESHAASFALLVYVSSYLKCYYPDVFACALLNSMPMGFYQPAQIVSDARAHHVEVRPVDINHSSWDNTLEEKETIPHALRLGFRQVKGLNQEEMDVLLSARKKGITSILALREAGVSQTALEKLADADAFRSIGLDRRRALWEISSLHDRPIGLFTGQASESTVEQPVDLPEMSAPEHVVQDYNAMALSLKAHPVSFVREKLSLLHVTSVKDLATIPDGMPVKVAGLILVRQRPGTASGVCFITIEDETGCANLVVFNQLFEKYRKEILQARLLMVEGKMQREGEVVHVVVRQCYNLNRLLQQMTAVEDVTVKQLEIKAGTEELKLPGARNFR
ncbi:error-prone DNA polymerase [Chitinophaga pinensis]|uniref:Error-prone DNA polymerase n=1 Tax=Chitinophaga pinensis (strain ATCC 43595 / DSM 2588 / LMG 13176 / NBRC 15968 / NCIMB 11800 / UQM 2034) TaxID=485918 RepID=A0A979GPU5_CHIPD|nr:error-prone DNA polymerase [Chitinophaga pinensis]ACU60847.1 DNA polymerase III, alpha subunit [Chitinophaga pinensis DSM 2588]